MKIVTVMSLAMVVTIGCQVRTEKEGAADTKYLVVETEEEKWLNKFFKNCGATSAAVKTKKFTITGILDRHGNITGRNDYLEFKRYYAYRAPGCYRGSEVMLLVDDKATQYLRRHQYRCDLPEGEDKGKMTVTFNNKHIEEQEIELYGECNEELIIFAGSDDARTAMLYGVETGNGDTRKATSVTLPADGVLAKNITIEKLRVKMHH